MTRFVRLKRMLSARRVCALVAVTAATLSSGAAAAAGPVYLARSQLVCLAEHADAYLALGDDPMVVLLDTCPSAGKAFLYVPGRLEDNLTVQQQANTSATRNAPPAEIHATPVLIITRAQLTCLAKRYAALPSTVSSDGIEVVRVDTLSCM